MSRPRPATSIASMLAEAGYAVEAVDAEPSSIGDLRGGGLLLVNKTAFLLGG